jgi:hypothetical protein
MQGCVHIVDDDASFATAMERRVAFFYKPFSVQELIEPINRVVGQGGAQ